jgi:plastocyanin
MRNYRSVVLAGRTGLVLAAIAAGFLLAACSGEDDTGAVFIDMKHNFFGREVTNVPVGEPVLFRNDGNSPHNAVAVDGSWSTEESHGALPIEPGEEAEVIIDEPGVYEYFCTYHGDEGGEGMAAVLVVGDVDYDPSSGATQEQEAVPEWSGETLRVPQDFDTIQEAVDATAPGDLVLVDKGIYREQVTIKTPSITLRGVDRDEVIVDAEFERPNAVEVFADGVAIENMTGQNAILNGFVWTSVTGYRGSYLNAYNNADYGIFAFDSTDGLFEHSFASGSPDSGFYIGQCFPCRAVVDRVTARDNSLGYSGTNAGGDLYIIRSDWSFNRAGIVPNTLDTELLPPERETTIVGNRVLYNDNSAPVAKPGTYAAFGNGIVLAGGNDNLVERNFIRGHEGHGILVTPNLDENFWFASGNVVRENIVTESGRADIALAGPAGPGNCFEQNGPSVTTIPPLLAELHGCDGTRLPMGFDLSTTLGTMAWLTDAPEGPISLDEVAAQPVKRELGTENQPDDAPVRPAVGVFDDYDLDLDEVAIPDEYLFRDGEDLMAYTAEGPGAFQLAFNLYGYLLPFLLLAAWSVLAFWDLARRDDLKPAKGVLWVGIILVVPFLGAIGYHLFGGSKVPVWLRWAVIGGGVLAYLVTFLAVSLVGGVL